MMNQNLTKKCIWTGQRDERVITVTLDTLDRFAKPTEKSFYVLPEYEQELREFNRHMLSGGRYFLKTLMWLIAGMVLVALSAILPGFENFVLSGTGLLLMLMGLLFIRYPFSTPETVEWLGLKKSISVIRYCGYFVIVIGLVVALLFRFL